MQRSLSAAITTGALSGIGLLALASTGVAQGSLPPNEYSINLPASGSNYHVRRFVAGKFNDTSLVDLALLRAGQVTVSYDPALGEASTLVEGIYNDLAAVSSGGGADPQRMIVVGDGLSVSELAWNSTIQDFTVQGLFDPTTQPYSYSTWENMSQVYSGQIDNAFGEDLVGVRPDKRSLQMALADGSGSFVHINAALFSPVSSGPISDVCIARTAGGFSTRVCVATGGRFLAFGPNGASVFEAQFGTTIMAIESLAVSAAGQSDVAMLVQMPDGGRRLYVLDGGTMVTLQELDLTSMAPTTIVSADYSGDGATDLMVTGGLLNEVTCLLRTNGLFSLQLGQVVAIEGPDNDGAAPGASVVVSDIDNDGDADALYPVGLTDQLFMAKNPTIDHRDFAPQILRADPSSPLHLWMPSEGLLAVRFEWPSDARPAPEQATHMQVMLWSSEQLPSGDYATAGLPDFNTSYSLTTSTLVQKDFEIEAEYIELGLDAFGSISPSTGIHYITVRYATLDANLNVVESWPHSTQYVATLENTAGMNYLSGLPFVVVGGELTTTAPGPGNGLSGGTQVGGTGATGCIPDYPPSTPPATTPTMPGA